MTKDENLWDEESVRTQRQLVKTIELHLKELSGMSNDIEYVIDAAKAAKEAGPTSGHDMYNQIIDTLNDIQMRYQHAESYLIELRARLERYLGQFYPHVGVPTQEQQQITNSFEEEIKKRYDMGVKM